MNKQEGIERFQSDQIPHSHRHHHKHRQDRIGQDKTTEIFRAKFDRKVKQATD